MNTPNSEPIFTLGGEEQSLFVTMGTQLIGEGRFEEAAHVFELLLYVDENNSFYCRAYGICCERCGQLDAARQSLDRAISLDPKDAYALATRASLRIVGGDKTGAMQDLQAAQAVLDSNDVALGRRIEALLRSAAA